MIVAIVNNDTIEQTGELSVLFPNVSHPASGPDPVWMAENNVIPVTYFKPYNSDTEKLVPCDPYLETGAVYAVTVDGLTADELTAKDDAAIASNKAFRNRMLSECDWTQLADVPLTADCKQAYAVYRQALRDADLLAPAWPAAPDEDWIA